MHPRVSLWAMHEHRIGLKPILRHVWAPTGEPHIASVSPGYDFLYLFAFVNPETGENHYWVTTSVDKVVYQHVMAAFSRAVGAGSDHHVLVVEDGAGFHVPPEEGHPPGIETVRLPPYSPELQPVERMWGLTDAPLFNRAFDSLEELDQLLQEQCIYLMDNPDLVSQHTLYHWWPLCTN